MLYFMQQMLNGLHIGAVYALLAFGYALIDGLLHRTNLAHGAIFGFAGQLMILVAVFGWQTLWLDLVATLAFGTVVALFYAGLVSSILSRSVFRRLAGRSSNTTVAATLGVSLVLMELGRIAAETHDFWLPPLLATPLVLASEPGFKVTLTVLQLIDCAVAAGALMLATQAMTGSAFGRNWQAASDDPQAAELCGVDVASVFGHAVIAGGLVAALAGILAALYYGNIGFGAGLVFGLKVLFVTAVGGYRAPGRAAVGGLVFGLAESLWSGYFPIQWRDAWVFGLLIALLVLRPERDEALSIGGRG